MLQVFVYNLADLTNVIVISSFEAPLYLYVCVSDYKLKLYLVTNL